MNRQKGTMLWRSCSVPLIPPQPYCLENVHPFHTDQQKLYHSLDRWSYRLKEPGSSTSSSGNSSPLTRPTNVSRMASPLSSRKRLLPLGLPLSNPKHLSRVGSQPHSLKRLSQSSSEVHIPKQLSQSSSQLCSTKQLLRSNSYQYHSKQPSQSTSPVTSIRMRHLYSLSSKPRLSSTSSLGPRKGVLEACGAEEFEEPMDLYNYSHLQNVCVLPLL